MLAHIEPDLHHFTRTLDSLTVKVDLFAQVFRWSSGLHQAYWGLLLPETIIPCPSWREFVWIGYVNLLRHWKVLGWLDRFASRSSPPIIIQALSTIQYPLERWWWLNRFISTDNLPGSWADLVNACWKKHYDDIRQLLFLQISISPYVSWQFGLYSDPARFGW